MRHHLLCHLACRLSGIILCLLVCLLSFSFPALGQTKNNPKEEESTCGLVSPELVFIQVEIVDKTGAPVTNLKADDFLIWEDGAKQTTDLVKAQKVVIAGKERIWYHVGYYTTNDKLDGTFRAIRIDVQEREEKGLSGSYWPNGYFAKRF